MIQRLPQELEQFVAQELARGEFASREELIVEGVRLLQERRRHLETLRDEIDTGLQQLERGEGLEIADEAAHRAFFDDIRACGLQRFLAKQQKSCMAPAISMHCSDRHLDRLWHSQ